MLFWNINVQKEYERIHHSDTIPVQPNDVAFAIHAFILTMVQIVQCFIYDVCISITLPYELYARLISILTCLQRGDQGVYPVTIALAVGACLGMLVLLPLAAYDYMSWFRYILTWSYVKVACTYLKYAPQVCFRKITRQPE